MEKFRALLKDFIMQKVFLKPSEAQMFLFPSNELNITAVWQLFLSISCLK